MYKIDLHTHTNASDGDLSPKELIDESIKRDISVLAITDHDTIEGIGPARLYVKDKSIVIVPGIEFSCEEKEKGFDEVHIIGLFIDTTNPKLLTLVETIGKDRIKQKIEMIKKLNELGYNINLEEVKDLVNFSFGRPHIAKILLQKYPNQFDSISDVFEKLLGFGKPAFVERRRKINIQEAIDTIKNAGGIVILAHPCLYQDHIAKELVILFKECGGDGIEVNYPYHKVAKNVSIEDANQQNFFLNELADNMNLLKSGGSDFHSLNERAMLGESGINSDEFEKLKHFHSKL